MVHGRRHGFGFTINKMHAERLHVFESELYRCLVPFATKCYKWTYNHSQHLHAHVTSIPYNISNTTRENKNQEKRFNIAEGTLRHFFIPRETSFRLPRSSRTRNPPCFRYFPSFRNQQTHEESTVHTKLKWHIETIKDHNNKDDEFLIIIINNNNSIKRVYTTATRWN